MVKKQVKNAPEKSKVTKHARRLSKRFSKLKVRKNEDDKAVLYVGHLPKGFNEKELKDFFGQFGNITKIRVSRSKKTARSRGYAYLEVKGDTPGEGKKIAEIAAKAMNKYMIFDRALDVKVVEETHRDLFKHGNREWKFVPTQAMFRSKKNSEAEEKTPEQRKARIEGLLQKEKEKRDRLKELEIDYTFPGFKEIVD